MKETLSSYDAWWLWGMLAISLLMTAEYTRIVMTTEVQSYRYFVLVVWVGLTLFSVARVVRFHSRKRPN